MSYTAKISFYALALSLFVESLVFAGDYCIERIEDSSVEAKMSGIEKVVKHNDIIRKVLYGAGFLAVAGGTVRFLYSWMSLNKAQIPESEWLSYTKQQWAKGNKTEAYTMIADKLALVDAVARNTANKVQMKFNLTDYFGSSAFSIAKSLIIFGLNTIATSLVSSQVLRGQRYCRTIFKERDIKWYLALHTHLGCFTSYYDVEGNPREQFEMGQLFKELKGIAHTFETRDAVSTEQADELLIIIRSVSSAIMREITRVIAYMNYMCRLLDGAEICDDLKKGIQAEMSAYSTYLCSHANTFAKKMEDIISNKVENVLKQHELEKVVCKFINDFNNLVSGFNRLQKESSQ